MSQRSLALLAATIATIIYGINHTVAKGLMPDVIQPYGFIFLRISGAFILFWLLSFFFPSEKIDRKDWLRIVACAFFGMTLNMLMFFKGLSFSTPINSSVVITTAPVLLLVMSALFLKEKITMRKFIGIGLGFIGTLVLILFGLKSQVNAPNIPLGNILFIINAISYSTYLIIVKPLVSKYSSITLMKWFFLFAFIINIPIGISEFLEVEWSQLSTNSIGQLAFVVIGTTFFTYLLNVFALKQLHPSTIGAFLYFQPIIATVYATLLGADQLTTLRVGAAALIFLGVFLSTRKSKVI